MISDMTSTEFKLLMPYRVVLVDSLLRETGSLSHYALLNFFNAPLGLISPVDEITEKHAIVLKCITDKILHKISDSGEKNNFLMYMKCDTNKHNQIVFSDYSTKLNLLMKRCLIE